MADDTFHWADYLVFILSLTVSLCVGIYFAFTSRKNKTAEEFLLAGRSMNFLPVGISLLASSISAISVISVPSDIYYMGSVYLFVTLGLVVCGLVTCFVFIPTFHCMRITSAYEYFELRFGSPLLRKAISVTFAVGLLLYLSLILYAPALAFSEVTGLNISFSILTCGLVCTLYTAVGGIKAVIWTDVIQMSTVFIGLILLAVMGIYHDDVGGPSVVLDRARDGDRLDLGVWDIDPRVRHTFWTQVIGQAFIWTATFGTSQVSVQRYLTIEKERDAQLSVVTMIAGIWILYTVVGILSLTMYAFYYQCDPYEANRIPNKDQIIPRFLMDVMGDLHGLPGLFTAAVFSAAISTISSSVNSLAAVTLEDFVKPAYRTVSKLTISDVASWWTCRVMAFIYGFVTIGLSFVPEYLGSNVLTVVGGVYGILSAPVMGCFTLGLFIPWCTSTGCMLGLLGGVFIGMWMNIGSVLHGSPVDVLPLSVAGCPNTTSFRNLAVAQKDEDPLQDFYDVSYAWYGVITWATVMIVGVVVSFIELRCRGKRLEEVSAGVDRSLMFDMGSCCYCCWPGRRKVECTRSSGGQITGAVEKSMDDDFTPLEHWGNGTVPTSKMWEDRPYGVQARGVVNNGYVTSVCVN